MQKSIIWGVASLRYVFIINPVAGKKGAAVAMGEKIRAFCREQGLEAVFYQTESCGHARELARKEACLLYTSDAADD